MSEKKFSMDMVKRVAAHLKFKGDLHQLQIGMNHEGTEHPDVTKGSPTTAGRIAKSHLDEFPNYYTMLNKMEKGVQKKK